MLVRFGLDLVAVLPCTSQALTQLCALIVRHEQLDADMCAWQDGVLVQAATFCSLCTALYSGCSCCVLLQEPVMPLTFVVQVHLGITDMTQLAV